MLRGNVCRRGMFEDCAAGFGVAEASPEVQVRRQVVDSWVGHLEVK